MDIWKELRDEGVDSGLLDALVVPKEHLPTVEDLLECYHENSRKKLTNDRMLLK